MLAVESKARRSLEYKVMRNGVIRITRHFPDLLAEWRPEQIPDYLAEVDHTLTLDSRKKYKKLLRKRQMKFHKLVHEMKDLGLSLIVNLQGRDGAGKTGTVKCLNEALWNDTRIITSVPMGAPSEDDKKYHYLWRMDKYDHHPMKGQVRVRDRGWQERVLVEKVMALTPEHEIKRSYTELRAYEWALERHGSIVVKIWLDITMEEQAARFEKRAREKPEKLTKEDDVARANWDGYTAAANELFHRTSAIPQNIVASDNKPYCHIAILEICIDALEKRIKRETKIRKQLEKANKKD